MPPEALFDSRAVDFNRVVIDREEIRRHLPQRFEMEQLDAIVHIDKENHLIVAYKDVRPDEFWVRGHMPGYPLMPGVLICEAAAQLCGFYSSWRPLVDPRDFIAFFGMDNVRFRGPVRPGDRLVIVGKAIKVHRRQVHSAMQAFVGETMVFQGNIIGTPYSRSDRFPV